MIDISEVANGVLVSAIGATGKWLATAARAPRGRKAEDLSVARWFETYKLTADPPEALSSLAPSDAELVADALRGPDIQGTLQELLSARLTNAPEADAARARDAFCLTLTLAAPAATSFASALADYYDEQISELVARLQASDPALLSQIRSEALSARMIAALNAIERHTAALQSAPRDANTFLSNYRRQIIDHHGKLQPPDFDRRRRVPIRDIYVPGLIIEEAPVDLGFETFQNVKSVTTHTIWELATLVDRSVLLGDPGGGKTTASNVLMHHFASDSSSRVPFLVTLRDFASEDPPSRSVVGHIEHLLETFYQCPAPAGLVDALLLTGRAIVFFDGLDELLDPTRRAGLAERVERFCTEYPLSPVLVTSRVVGYDQVRLDDRQFTCYRLGGFSDEDVADYARKWFALEDGCQPEDADTFLTESESVPDLRTNPLLLSLMCILYRGEGSLPRNRAEVYEQCASLLFRKWDARRKIHSRLRAAHLVEPALRHLAWWLFTREETQSAVTERELVVAATEFLHGRGFESIEEARDAAQEFIEFCRGRMWVFSDTGTTATGENLYSFTHRTFLEHFAAGHLAYESDTPEKLARTLAPHVARGEWEVVGELAVQIKDSTSSEGARRVYKELLGERRRRAPKGRSNILQFLARTLRSVDPSPQIARRLTREIADFLFSGDPDDSIFGLPIAWLLGSCSTFHETISDELIRCIEKSLNSDIPQIRCNGIRTMMTLEVPLYGNWGGRAPYLPKGSRLRLFWKDKSRNLSRIYRDRIIEASYQDRSIRRIAIESNSITIDQALEMPGTITLLLCQQRGGIYGLRYTSPLLVKLFFVAHGWHGKANYQDEAISFLSAMGHWLARNPRLPWADGPGESWATWAWMDDEYMSPVQPSKLDELAFLGGTATLLISAEGHGSTPSSDLDSPDRFGAFRDLYWYIETRKTGTPEPQQLPDLPVPDEFKELFRDWAGNKVNFVGNSQTLNSD